MKKTGILPLICGIGCLIICIALLLYSDWSYVGWFFLASVALNAIGVVQLLERRRSKKQQLNQGE